MTTRTRLLRAVALLGVCVLILTIGTPGVDALVITTADGGGADCEVSSLSGDDNYQESGDNMFLGAKWATAGSPAYEYDRMIYLKFDLDTLSYADTAELKVMNGYVGGLYPMTMDIYGLKDSEYADGWGEYNITWNNAPGNDRSGEPAAPHGLIAAETTYLGTYTFLANPDGRPASVGDIVTLASGPDLADFLNADTDGLATFILTSGDYRPNTYNVGLMGKDNTAVTNTVYNTTHGPYAPRLEITEGPEPIFAQPAGFRYLAADPSLRAGLSNATVRMGQATHVGEVLRMEEDWEAGLVTTFVSGLVTDPATDKLRMYYEVRRNSDGQRFVGMAESDDGVNWTKPELNITGTRYVNDSRNNFIDHQQSARVALPSVFVDPNGPDEERYKMSRLVHEASAPDIRQLITSVSADGLHFHDVGMADQPDNGLDSLNITFWDPTTEQYHAYMRWNFDPSARGVTHKRSDTWEGTWSGGREYTIDPDRDSLSGVVYDNGIMPYHGQYIGLPAMFYGATNRSIYPAFMYSRDGSEWHFEDDDYPAIDLGAHGQTIDTFGMAYPGTSIVERDGKLWIYYTYSPDKHGDHVVENYTTHLATIRQDGFVAIESEPGQLGTWTTSTIKLPQESVALLINAEVSGSLYVEVLDPTTMTPLPGFTGAEAVPIGQGDYLDVAASWLGSGLGALADQEVVFRFALDDASIYSFSFAAMPQPGDANGDGCVDEDDAAILATHWLVQSGAVWADGDFNYDGMVDDKDATIMAANWQVSANASVPEPGVVVLLLCGMASLGMLTRIRMVIER